MISDPPSATSSCPGRRGLLKRAVSWASAAGVAFLLYPLLRFSGFRVQPKPRYVSVPAPLPANGFHTERDFILFDREGTFGAVSRTCTHLGCRINYHEDKKRLECPCHQSQFTAEGVRVAGPARRDLQRYPVEVQRDPGGEISAYVVQL